MAKGQNRRKYTPEFRQGAVALVLTEKRSIPDAAVVRKATLDQYPDSWGLLIDWARGTLREPSFYFEDAPYYRAQQRSRE